MCDLWVELSLVYIGTEDVLFKTLDDDDDV